jgi:hypothetical protein
MATFTVDPTLYASTGGVLPWPTPSPLEQFAFLRDGLNTAKSTSGSGHVVSLTAGSFDIRWYSSPIYVRQIINGKKVKVQTGWKLATNGAPTLARSALSGLTIQGAGSGITRITGNARLYTRQSDGTPPVNMTVRGLTLDYTTGAQGYIFAPSTGSIPFPATPTITGFSVIDVSFVGRHEGNRGVSGTYGDITGSKDVLFDGILVDLYGQYGYNRATGEGGGFFLFSEGGQNITVRNSTFREDGYSSSLILLFSSNYSVDRNQFIGGGLIKQDDGTDPAFNPRGERFYNAGGSFTNNTLSAGSFFDYFYLTTAIAGTFGYTTSVSGNTFEMIPGGFGVLIRSDASESLIESSLTITGNTFSNGIAVRSELESPSDLAFGPNTVNGVAFDQLRVGGNDDDVIHADAADGIRRWISGGPGDDVLHGSTNGLDAFVFWASLDAATNLDTIINFQNALSLPSSARDQLWLANDRFRFLETENGALKATSFAFGAGGSPTAAVAQITYDTSTGQLAYDSDGTGALAAVAFARLEGSPAITPSDILLF